MNKIYDPDISYGITLKESDCQNLKFTFSNQSGFVLREVIEEILDIPNCIGIRFYAMNDNHVHYILVSGVHSNGWDIRPYYRTAAIFGNVSTKLEPEHKRNDFFIGSIKVQISAFYSKSDLENYLLDGKPDGLSFYLAELSRLEEFKFNEYYSLIAFPTKLTHEGKELPMSPDITRNMLSLHPSPGHGAAIDYKINQNKADFDQDDKRILSRPFLKGNIFEPFSSYAKRH